MHLKALLKQHEEWLRWNKRINHFPCTKIRKLAEKSVLPHSFTKLHALPLCPSFAFRGQKRKERRTGNAYNSIRKIDHSVPGSLACVYHLISAHTSIVHHSSGRLTASSAWYCNLFYDMFIRCGHGFMMRNTSLQPTIDLKKIF